MPATAVSEYLLRSLVGMTGAPSGVHDQGAADVLSLGDEEIEALKAEGVLD